MALQLRVTLVTGKVHRVPLNDEDPAVVIEKLKQGTAPFSAKWLETEDGELLNFAAIASVYVEPA